MGFPSSMFQQGISLGDIKYTIVRKEVCFLFGLDGPHGISVTRVGEAAVFVALFSTPTTIDSLAPILIPFCEAMRR